MICFWILLVIWAFIQICLFFAAQNSVGQAMPLAPLLFWVWLIGGLIFFLILHIIVRKYGG